MTVNERMFAAGLLGMFDAALHARDRATLVKLYRQVGLGDVAESSVDALIRAEDGGGG